MSAWSVRALLFTDIEGSTALVHRLGDRYEQVLGRLQSIVRAAAVSRDGVEESREGDSLFITFPSATAALESAVDAQRRIEREPWPPDGRVRVRMGVHVGEVAESRAGLVGLAIHQAARIMGVGHGGQIVVSGDVVRQAGRLPPETTTRSLGTYDLRDIGAVELLQLEHPDLQDDFPPLRTGAVPAGLGRSNLPRAVGPIVGRQLELVTLEKLLHTDRLVTLTGVGGIGKSRLAIELATRTAGGDEFGPYFVDLAPIGDNDLVPAAFAAAFEAQVEPNADVMALVRSVLADQSVVVVVDNCEHLLPGIAELLGELLGSSPGLRIVATSREPVGVAGERVCPVDPLRVPPAVASIEDVEASAAGALFLARLPMNLTTGPLSPDEIDAVGTICRTVDGIPLGLELAAARGRTLSLPDLAAHLDRSINEFAPPRHGVTARHRTMRAALDWGYDLLTPSAQTALRAMSVFAGGCELPAFAAVCHDDEHRAAVDVLDELVRTSFVTVDFARERARYRLLEPVRQYAHERLDADGETADRQCRHLEHYLDVARSLTRDVDGLGETKYDDLRPELGNFRAALDWAASDAEGAEAGMSLASRLWELWTSEAHHHEGLSRLVGLLATGGGSPAVRSEATYRAGFIAADLGDDNQGLALAEAALAEAQAGGDRLGELRARRVLSLCAFEHLGDLDTARRQIDMAIQISEELANDLLRAKCMLELANLVRVTGSLDESRHRIQRLLDGPAGSVLTIEMYAHIAFAEILFNQGSYAGARTAASRALVLAESQNLLPAMVRSHFDLAAIECAAGALDASAAHIACAQEIKPATARTWEPVFLTARADLALASGEFAAALCFAKEAVAIEDDSYSAGVQGIANLRYLGDAQLAVGNATDALATYQRLLSRAGAAHYAIRLAEGHEGAAAVAAALGNDEDAAGHLVAAREIRERTRSQRLPRPAVDRLLAALEAAPRA